MFLITYWSAGWAGSDRGIMVFATAEMSFKSETSTYSGSIIEGRFVSLRAIRRTRLIGDFGFSIDCVKGELYLFESTELDMC